MTDLTYKFTELRQQMAQQHAEMLLAVQALSSQNLAVQLAQQHNELLTVLQANNGGLSLLLSQQHSESLGVLNSINSNAITTRSRMIEGFEDVIGELGGVKALIQSSNNNLTNIYTRLTQIKLLLDDDLAGLQAYLLSLSTEERQQLAVQHTETGVQIDYLISTLEQLRDCSCALSRYIVPQDPAPDGGGCASPLQSVGVSFSWLPDIDPSSSSAEIQDFGVVAAWPQALPSGVVGGYSGGMSSGPGFVTLTADWSGWSIYVKSTSRTYSDSTTQGLIYPTGVWRALSGNRSLCVWVPQGETIEVSLCGPGTGTGGGGSLSCEGGILGTSEMVSWNFITPERQAATWSSGTVTALVPDRVGKYASAQIYLSGDYEGWRVKTTTPDISILRYIDNGSSYYVAASLIPVTEVGFVITDTTSYIAVMNSSDFTTAFAVELCPPAPI